MKLIAAVIAATLSWSGSSFQPQVSQLSALVPIGTVLEYSLPTLPPGDQFQWADGECISNSAFPDFTAAIGTTYGGCPSGFSAKPDRRSKFARGWTPASIQGVKAYGTAASNYAAPVANGFRTGMKIRVISSPLTGLATGTDYYAVINPANSQQIGFATSRANALAGTLIAISGTANMNVSQWEDPDALTRQAAASGQSDGIQMGTYQADALQYHEHQILYNFNVGGGSFGTSAPGALDPANYRGRATTIDVGRFSNNETRSVNISMGYIVRVK
jgi:hypothetical protein